jgi:hypothetical protein
MLGVSLAACKGQSHLEAYRPTPTTLAPTTTTAPAPVPDGVPAPTKIAL